MHADIYLANGRIIPLPEVPEEDAADLLALQDAWLEHPTSPPGILSVTVANGKNR